GRCGLAAEEVDDRLHRDPRRNLARIVPAHAVGNHRQIQPVVDREAVFIRRSNAASVRDSMRAHHSTHLWMRSYRPNGRRSLVGGWGGHPGGWWLVAGGWWLVAGGWC